MDLSVFKPHDIGERLQRWTTWEDWQDRAEFGDKYSWYAGYGYYAQPQSILEVGVKFGYSIASMCLGFRDRHPGKPLVCVLLDNDSAGGNVELVGKEVAGYFDCMAYGERFDSQSRVWQAPQSFDLIHIDACHEEEAAFNDLVHFAPYLAPGGMIVVDDTDDPAVSTAVMRFLGETEIHSRSGYVKWNVRRIPCTSGHILLSPE